MTVSHPAPFSPSIMEVLTDLIRDWPGPILDPYAGIGRVHELARNECDTWGIEIEKPWATHQHTVWADSSTLRRVEGEWADRYCSVVQKESGERGNIARPNAVVCSPDYGNRMCDQYLGTPEERRKRKETGEMPRRRGYAISLGRQVSEGSTAKYKFGPKYKAGHTKIFTAVTNVCLPDSKLALNVSDFFVTNAKGEDPTRVYVVAFWVELIASLGWVVERLIPVGTRRFRDGANSDLRVDAETVIVAQLKGAS